MKFVVAMLTILLAVSPAAGEQVKKPRLPRVAVICFFQYEQVSRMNKICYYDCLGSMAAITQSSISLCPLSIAR